jgi:hypothetical protein
MPRSREFLRAQRVKRDEVYFIRGGDAIKIGYTQDVVARLSALQTASSIPLELLASIDGDKAEEVRQHRRWRHLRIRGEWFEAGEDLLGYIDELNGRTSLVVDEQTREQATQFQRVLSALDAADLAALGKK